MTIVTDSNSIKNYNKFNLKYERRLFYGYDGPEDGFHKWLDTKFKEFESSNKQGSISLKDSGEVPERARHPALLRKQERDNLLQDSPLRISGEGVAFYASKFRILTTEDSDKVWYSFCSTDKS